MRGGRFSSLLFAVCAFGVTAFGATIIFYWFIIVSISTMDRSVQQQRHDDTVASDRPEVAAGHHHHPVDDPYESNLDDGVARSTEELIMILWYEDHNVSETDMFAFHGFTTAPWLHRLPQSRPSGFGGNITEEISSPTVAGADEVHSDIGAFDQHEMTRGLQHPVGDPYESNSGDGFASAAQVEEIYQRPHEASLVREREHYTHMFTSRGFTMAPLAQSPFDFNDGWTHTSTHSRYDDGHGGSFEILYLGAEANQVDQVDEDPVDDFGSVLEEIFARMDAESDEDDDDDLS